MTEWIFSDPDLASCDCQRMLSMRTAILVRDVPYGTLQLIFFEFFKELPFFSSDSFRIGRLELKACDFVGRVRLCVVEHYRLSQWKEGWIVLLVNMQRAKFVGASQNSGDILVQKDFYTSYNKVLTLR